MTPLLPDAVIDPPDASLRPAMDNFLKSTNAPAFSRYSFRRHDLNGDGRREALVILTNPYGYWCGLYGCTLLVMEANNDGFTLSSTIQTVREPIYISDIKTNGWNDIIVRVSGRWSETKDVALQFNGAAYPPNPSELPSYLQLASSQGTKLFNER